MSTQSNQSQIQLAVSIKPLSAIMFALFASFGVQAQEAALAPVVVSEQAYSDTTAVVSSEAIAAHAARDAREILQNEAGVAVGGGGTAIAQKIYVRNIEDTLLTVTLDGVPQGGNIFHHQGRVLIDPQLLKRIEIDKGGTVASVGPGGLAGSVRMTTKDARDLLRPGQKIGGILNGGVASNDGWRGGATVYGAPVDGLDFLFYAKRNETADYKDGEGKVQKNSGSTQDSQLAKLNWQLAPGHKLFFGYQTLEDQGTRFLRPHMPGIVGGPATPQKLEQRTMTAGYRFAGGDGLPSAELEVFSDETKNTRSNTTAVFNKPVGYFYGEKIDASGLNLTLGSKVGAATLRYGLNHHRRELEAINPNQKGVNGNTGREESEVTGLFAEGSVPLAANLLLGLGARYDWYSYTDNHNQTFKSDGLSPNASLTLLASEALSFRLGASHTVRGPGLKEGFMIDNGPGVAIYRNVAGLKEEKADNVELGFNYDGGPWSFKGSVFHMEIDDYINMVFSGGTARRENVGKVKSNGYELGGGWKQGAFRAGLAVSQAKPKLNGNDLGDGDFSLGVSTGRTWLLSAGYALPAWNLDFGWNARIVEKLSYRPSGAAAEWSKKGYTVHDVQANWQPLGKDRVRVTLSVRNLFDKFYYDQTTYGAQALNGPILGYAEPGRDVRLDLNWKF
ncbi:MAG: hypothetical protein BGO63_13185 [Candidatus Accumulibacter sp. 66-26]|nr:TonB-dependent receptor [Accumulibacter sp.]OJW52369.1 MAG: hypothetical protein BGO63_13185 [Candidatus Accumulibacter sp. 66-26]